MQKKRKAAGARVGPNQSLDCFRIRKSARSLLDFKDGLTAGEVKLLLAVATGKSLAAIQGRRFREKFPDLAAVFALGPQDRAGSRRNARRPSRVVEDARSGGTR